MAQWIDWGNGHDGSPNAISGTVNTYASCTGTATQTVLTTTLSAGAGDVILCHQSQGTGAGKWEIVGVASDAGATLNLTSALTNSYSAGAQCVLIPQYTGGTLSGAVTATAWNGSVGGIIALMSSGDLTISGSLSVVGNGFRGGVASSNQAIGYSGEGTVGTTLQQLANRGNGGGGARADASSSSTASGAPGGNGEVGGAVVGNTPYTAGTAGVVSGNAGLTNITFGGGSGGGGGDQNGPYGAGVSGGGIIFIFAKNITVTGSIVSTGTAGTAGYYTGGSGGAGGSILIKCQTAILGTNKITAAGGTYGVDGAYRGGAGGVGRIRCDYYTSVTGTTTPALSSAEDPSLNVPGNTGAFFQFL